jgi:hypothetical protein
MARTFGSSSQREYLVASIHKAGIGQLYYAAIDRSGPYI